MSPKPPRSPAPPWPGNICACSPRSRTPCNQHATAPGQCTYSRARRCSTTATFEDAHLCQLQQLQPTVLAESHIKCAADAQDHCDHEKITVRPLKLGHVLE